MQDLVGIVRDEREMQQALVGLQELCPRGQGGRHRPSRVPPAGIPRRILATC